jgi:nucleoside-diphosphate-sugar epimerase
VTTTLVTGAAGFIGSYVVRQLLDEGEDVVGFDRAWPGSLPAVLGDRADAFPQVTGVVEDFAALSRAASDHGVERVVHLAAELHAASAADPGLCIRSNVTGNHNALELARVLPIAKVVTASSAALFGPPSFHPDGPMGEDVPLRPGDVYEAAKAFGEVEGAFYAERFGVDTTAIRVGLAYGHGCLIGTGRMFADELLDKPRRGLPGRAPWGDASINWLHAVDAAGAFVAASRSATPLPAYNLRGDHRPIAEAVAVARDLLPGADIEVVPGTHPWAQDFDDEAFRKDTGFAATWTLEQGLADTLERMPPV